MRRPIALGSLPFQGSHAIGVGRAGLLAQLILPGHSGQPIQVDSFEGALDAGNLFLKVSVPLLDSFETDVASVYARAFNLAEHLGYRYLERSWNFIPRINQARSSDPQGLTHYRLLNAGRCTAFEGQSVYVPSAATGVGTERARASFAFVFSKEAVLTFENARQTPASQYSDAYSPKPPLFARMAYNPQTQALWISGTASILESKSVHWGQFQKQTLQSLDNIQALLTAHGFASALPGLNYCAYFPDDHQVQALSDLLSPSIRGCAYVHADLCRPELMIEFEAANAGACLWSFVS